MNAWDMYVSSCISYLPQFINSQIQNSLYSFVHFTLLQLNFMLPEREGNKMWLIILKTK